MIALQRSTLIRWYFNIHLLLRASWIFLKVAMLCDYCVHRQVWKSHDLWYVLVSFLYVNRCTKYLNIPFLTKKNLLYFAATPLYQLLPQSTNCYPHLFLNAWTHPITLVTPDALNGFGTYYENIVTALAVLSSRLAVICCILSETGCRDLYCTVEFTFVVEDAECQCSGSTSAI